MSTNACAFKLINGEEVIGVVVAEDEDAVEIRNPRIVTLQPIAQGKVTLILIPFVLSNRERETVTISKHAILCCVEAEEEMNTRYLEETTTIQLTGA